MITIIVPTYNETENITRLRDAIHLSLQRAQILDYEILVMDDDSPDETADVVNAWQDPRVRAVNRRGKMRGLSAAVIDGFGEAKGDIVGVMDADMSHPPSVLPKLIEAVQGGMNLAIGSRYVAGGAIENWPFKRRFTSKAACFLALPVTRVQDATSGFFMMRKSIVEGVRLNPAGFKIGLEVCVKSKHQGRWKEIPYTFTDRTAGESKLSLYVIWCYIKQLLSIAKDKMRGD
jgi:dolichol-phosphate mannosyltransferase